MTPESLASTALAYIGVAGAVGGALLLLYYKLKTQIEVQKLKSDAAIKDAKDALEKAHAETLAKLAVTESRLTANDEQTQRQGVRIDKQADTLAQVALAASPAAAGAVTNIVNETPAAAPAAQG